MEFQLAHIKCNLRARVKNFRGKKVYFVPSLIDIAQQQLKIETGANMKKKTELSAEDCIAIWSKAIDTQMHFNEMSVKTRQLGLTFVAASLGVAIVILGQGDAFYLTLTFLNVTFNLHVAVIIILAAAAAMFAVRILDTGVYHMMLRGAVTFGEDFEARHLRNMIGGEKGMTEAISHFSRYKYPKVERNNDGCAYTGTCPAPALNKIKRFYNVVIFTLSISAFITFVATQSNNEPDKKVLVEQELNEQAQ